MPDTKTILVVEDDRFLSKVYEKKLQKEGYNVALAIEGFEAIRRVNETKPDLVLLDLILPGKSGFEILAELKASASTKNIPVMILSNLGQEEDMVRGKELGAIDYIVKSSMSIHDVVQRIKEFFVKKK